MPRLLSDDQELCLEEATIPLSASNRYESRLNEFNVCTVEEGRFWGCGEARIPHAIQQWLPAQRPEA